MAGQIHLQYFPDLGLEVIQAADVTHHLAKHVHDTLCVGIITKGTRECELQGVKSFASSGQIVVVNPGEIHACRAADDQPYSYLMLCLEIKGITRLYRQCTGNDAGLPYFKNNIIDEQESFLDIVRLGNLLNGSSSKLEREVLLTQLFCGLILRYAAEKSQNKHSGQEDTMVLTVREYVEAHCTEEISLEFLARLVNFSPYYLHRLFTAQTGIPIHAYQMLKRINKAKNLLVEGKSFARAAAETGFVDQSHFSRRFKEFIGLTPGQWREAHIAK